MVSSLVQVEKTDDLSQRFRSIWQHLLQVAAEGAIEFHVSQQASASKIRRLLKKRLRFAASTSFSEIHRAQLDKERIAQQI